MLRTASFFFFFYAFKGILSNIQGSAVIFWWVFTVMLRDCIYLWYILSRFVSRVHQCAHLQCAGLPMDDKWIGYPRNPSITWWFLVHDCDIGRHSALNGERPKQVVFPMSTNTWSIVWPCDLKSVDEPQDSLRPPHISGLLFWHSQPIRHLTSHTRFVPAVTCSRHLRAFMCPLRHVPLDSRLQLSKSNAYTTSHSLSSPFDNCNPTSMPVHWPPPIRQATGRHLPYPGAMKIGRLSKMSWRWPVSMAVKAQERCLFDGSSRESSRPMSQSVFWSILLYWFTFTICTMPQATW
jgi:hypothetical protein